LTDNLISDKTVKSSSINQLFTELSENINDEQYVELLTSKIVNLLHQLEIDSLKYDLYDILYKLMDLYKSNGKIQLNNLEILENVFKILIIQKRIEQKNQTSSLKHETISSKFIEKLFYIFLVTIKKSSIS
jgi:hypothetical protein